MTGQLTVTKMTCNQISVTWKPALVAHSYPSPSFSLLSDGDLITFRFEFTTTSSIKICIKKMSTHKRNAIITVVMRAKTNRSAIRVMFLKSCEGSDSICVDEINPRDFEQIQCNIKLLGLSNSTTIPTTCSMKELCIPNVSHCTELEPNLKLVMNDGDLLAHKNVLTLHSPVLFAMFTTPMKESEENRVIIEDIDLNTMKTVLGILYSGETEELNDTTVALKVLAVAEKYQILILKRVCDSKLQLSVKKENVLQLLDEAIKYNLAGLADFCITYIIATQTIPIKEVIKLLLKNPNLAIYALASQIENLA